MLAASMVAAEKPEGTPPKVISRVEPEYPFSLRLSGNKGDVVLEFVVDKDGEVRNPVIVKSSHPEFEAPAVEALLKWKFKPAVVKGRTVNTRMRLPIHFELRGGRRAGPDGTGVEPFSIPPKPPKNIPEPLRYDQPPRPLVIGAPVYPFELLEQKLKGSATVNFLVDPSGHTREVTVHEATQPEFGAAAAAMISAWEFEPARKDGKPSWALLSRKQVFDRTGRDSPVNASAERLLKALKQNPSPVLETMRELDAVPKARYQPRPALPEAMIKNPEAAEASIEFIIDRTGRAQLPRVVSATREDFGWAAATAVARWQFVPPTKDGKPVDVKARVPVTYTPHAKDTAAAKSE